MPETGGLLVTGGFAPGKKSKGVIGLAGLFADWRNQSVSAMLKTDDAVKQRPSSSLLSVLYQQLLRRCRYLD